jgi:hypothetical protein
MLWHACGFKLANDGRDTSALQAYLGHKKSAADCDDREVAGGGAKVTRTARASQC